MQLLGGSPLVGSSKASTPRATESSTLRDALLASSLQGGLHQFASFPRQGKNFKLVSKARPQQFDGVHPRRFHEICDHPPSSLPLPRCRLTRISRFPIQYLTQELWEKPQGRAGQSSSEHALDLHILQILRIDMSKCETKKPRCLTCDLRSTLSAYSAASMRHSQSHCLMFHVQGNDKGTEILNICSVLCFP